MHALQSLLLCNVAQAVTAVIAVIAALQCCSDSIAVIAVIVIAALQCFSGSASSSTAHWGAAKRALLIGVPPQEACVWHPISQQPGLLCALIALTPSLVALGCCTPWDGLKVCDVGLYGAKPEPQKNSWFRLFSATSEHEGGTARRADTLVPASVAIPSTTALLSEFTKMSAPSCCH